MKHLKHLDLLESFPYDRYEKVKGNQQAAFEIIERNEGSGVTLELPTGTGKTAIGYTYLKHLERKGTEGPLLHSAYQGAGGTGAFSTSRHSSCLRTW